MNSIKKLSITDVTAIYAAIISTITLIWAIIGAILEKMARVKIRVGISARFELIDGVGAGSADYIIGIKIINKSSYNIYINKPAIKLQKKIDGFDTWQAIIPDDSIKYPLTIKPRAQQGVEIKIGDSLVELLEKHKKGNGKIRIVVEDTIGKKFYSNKLSVKEIIQLGKAAKIS